MLISVAGGEVAPVVCRVHLGALQRSCGIFAKEVYAENGKHYAAYYLYGELVGVDESGYEAEAESCKQAVCEVA